MARPRASVRRLLGRIPGLHRPATSAPAPRTVADVVTAELERLAVGEQARVAVLHDDRVPAWTGRIAPSGLTLVPNTASATERHVLLTAQGPFDLIVDTSERHQGRGARLATAFYQLRVEGAYVVRRGAVELGPDHHGLGELLELVAAVRSAPPDKPTRRERDAVGLARAIAGVRTEGAHLVLVNGVGDALPKLRQVELDELVSRRPDLGVRTLRVVEAESFTSRCDYHAVGTRPGPPPPTEYQAPAVSLREYRDALVLPGQVVSVDRFVAPDTYRHHLQRRLRNRYLTEQSARFARLPDGTGDPVPLAGSYYHLDNEVRGHYGHLMTEQLSRMWAWDECKAADPDLKVLVGVNWRRGIQPYELTIYAAAGIDLDDIVMVDGPVRVERLISPSPLLSMPEYVHPYIRETWRRVGDRLAADATGTPRPARIFCSRRLSKRSCLNTPEVEDIFRAAGFSILYPEDLSIPDQVATFRAADVVAGFAGSGLFNLCFVDEPVPVITLRSETYTATNEYLIASVLGHPMDVVVSAAESRKFQSEFTFDVEHEGRMLAEILAALPG